MLTTVGITVREAALWFDRGGFTDVFQAAANMVRTND
jgi:hypothetical protein